MISDGTQELFMRNLNHYIAASGKTQKQIAKDLDISPQLLNSWSKGVAMPRMDRVQRLANYFKVYVSDLIEDHLFDIKIKTEAEIICEKVYKLNQAQLKHLNAYVDLLLSEQEDE